MRFSKLLFVPSLFCAACLEDFATGDLPADPSDLPEGALVTEETDDGLAVKGRLAFHDADGNTVAGPDRGALVVAGEEHRLVGVSADGSFSTTMSGTEGASWPILVGAEGYAPLAEAVPGGATSLPEGTLALEANEGTDAGDDTDNCACDWGELGFGIDGLLRHYGPLPSDSEFVGGFVEDEVKDADDFDFDGVSGEAFDTEYGSSGDSLYEQTVIPGPDVAADSWDGGYNLLFAVFTSVEPGFCFNVGLVGQIRVSDYDRTGATVSGKVVDNAGNPVAGATVVISANGDGTNRVEKKTDANGKFSGTLPTQPPNGVRILTFDDTGRVNLENKA